MNFTPQEIDQYIRITLKQWGLSDVQVFFKDLTRSRGYFYANKNEIILSTNTLENFARLKQTLLHEMAHALDFKERGTFQENGRNNFHGKHFKKWCNKLGVSSNLRIA